MTDVYVCIESAAFEYEGNMVVVNKGFTRVRAGHPILDAYPDLFEPITVHYDVERRVEQATAGPGEKRSLPLPPSPKPVDELVELRAEAEQVGVTVDKRWGAERLRSEIDKATSDG